jgi:hypothetical protein
VSAAVAPARRGDVRTEILDVTPVVAACVLGRAQPPLDRAMT